ncbi:hypothetical protein [Nocardioides bruguierae]|uniref:hypothetical protein n=1 Tax=Nocardioides bruguierae TaxID=2945102 RepID=UPI002020B697|nr:hypothetical protein [Nocardioides bruguierae]MCL8025689.1 hypothetical protein [Nocardioides bruguierae]
MTLLPRSLLPGSPLTVTAHGLGGTQDLPLPAGLAVLGGALALLASFVVLARAWRTPRWHPTRVGTPAPRPLATLVASPAWRWGLRGLGMLGLAWAALAAFGGPDQLTNPLFGMVYVWWWVGVPLASLLLGPVWRAISPLRTLVELLARASGTDAERGLVDLPGWVGRWPAALGLLSFAFLELVHPHSTELVPVRVWCAGYVVVLVLGGVVAGTRWLDAADPMEAFSGLLARLSPWLVRDGRLHVVSPLANLGAAPSGPGVPAVVAVLLGSTAFDSLSDTPSWLRLVQDPAVTGTAGGAVLLGTAGLVGLCALVGALLALGARSLGVTYLAPAAVPLVAGYLVAHYLTFWWVVGQATLVQASDPLGTGANWLGTGTLGVDRWLQYHPVLVANVQLLAVVGGHVLAAVAAHERAVRVLASGRAVRGQVPMLLVMLVLTVGGLSLLLA